MEKLTIAEVSRAQCGLDILTSKGWLTRARVVVLGACLNCAHCVISLEELEKNLDLAIVDIEKYFKAGETATIVDENHDYCYTPRVISAVELEMSLNHELWQLAEALSEPNSGKLIAKKDRLRKIYDIVKKTYDKQRSLNAKGAEKNEQFSQFWFKMTD